MTFPNYNSATYESLMKEIKEYKRVIKANNTASWDVKCTAPEIEMSQMMSTDPVDMAAIFQDEPDQVMLQYLPEELRPIWGDIQQWQVNEGMKKAAEDFNAMMQANKK